MLSMSMVSMLKMWPLSSTGHFYNNLGVSLNLRKITQALRNPQAVYNSKLLVPEKPEKTIVPEKPEKTIVPEKPEKTIVPEKPEKTQEN